MITISWRYSQGTLNLEDATWLIQLKTGLDAEIAENFLKGLTRNNVIRLDFRDEETNP